MSDVRSSEKESMPTVASVVDARRGMRLDLEDRANLQRDSDALRRLATTLATAGSDATDADRHKTLI